MKETQTVKALFFDIDGTLLSPRTGRIPDSAVKALRCAREHGLMLFAATGRHSSALTRLPQIAELKLDGLICLNGQLCLHGGKTVFQNPIPRNEVEAFIRFMRGKDCIFQFSGNDLVFCSRNDDEVRTINEEFGIFEPPIYPPEHALSMDVLQIELFFREENALQVLEHMPSCRWTRWHLMGVDILRKDGGKWTGIQKIAEHLHLKEGEIMVFGDHDNDVDMLLNAKFSVALGNGSAQALAAAKYITSDIDEDGIYNAFTALLPHIGL